MSVIVPPDRMCEQEEKKRMWHKAYFAVALSFTIFLLPRAIGRDTDESPRTRETRAPETSACCAG